MPYIQPVKQFDLALQNNNNQVVPLFLSNKGRYVWSDKPFKFEVNNNQLILDSKYENIQIQKSGNRLKSAYLDAINRYFKSNSILPNELLFVKPQYNTWIELMYNQNQTDILKYANTIKSNGFPEGVLMIDDNWQRYYGNFDFRAEKSSDAKGMINELHSM